MYVKGAMDLFPAVCYLFASATTPTGTVPLFTRKTL